MPGTRVHVLGGLNEIGGTKLLLEEGDDRLLLDFGTSMGSRARYYEEFLTPRTTTALHELLELGLLPRVDGLYRQDLIDIAEPVVSGKLPESAQAYEQRTGEPFVHGILLTHAHLDHYGDLGYVDPVIPVHCSRTTRAMLEAIDALGGAGIEGEIVTVTERRIAQLSGGATFPEDLKIETSRTRRRLEVLPENAWFHVGPFRVLAVPVDHSVAGACAFLVETPSGKRVFYTGDLRVQGSLASRTKVLREVADGLQPDLLLTEGTRIDSDEQEDEQGVERDVRGLVEDCHGLAVTEFAWKDTTRFDTIQRVAQATGRELVIHPKLAYLLKRLDHITEVPSRAPEAYDNVSVYLRRRDTMQYRPSDYTRYKHEAGYQTEWDTTAIRAAWKSEDEVALRDSLAHWREGTRAEQIRDDPESYIVHLSFYDSAELFDLDPPPGSRWIRCLTEPFSDEMALSTERQCTWLERFGMDHNVPPRETLDGTTHVSGHASGPDLAALLATMDAAKIAPIHTEQPEHPRFQELGGELVTFPGWGVQQAAQGKAVIEL